MVSYYQQNDLNGKYFNINFLYVLYMLLSMDNDLLSSILCESYKTCNEKNLCVSHDLYFIGELHHKIRMLSRFYRRNNFKS